MPDSALAETLALVGRLLVAMCFLCYSLSHSLPFLSWGVSVCVCVSLSLSISLSFVWSLSLSLSPSLSFCFFFGRISLCVCFCNWTVKFVFLETNLERLQHSLRSLYHWPLTATSVRFGSQHKLCTEDRRQSPIS